MVEMALIDVGPVEALADAVVLDFNHLATGLEEGPRLSTS